jgi:hypothetical protein
MTDDSTNFDTVSNGLQDQQYEQVNNWNWWVGVVRNEGGFTDKDIDIKILRTERSLRC